MAKREGLTPLQQRFVEEYLINPNATEAAGKAGYSDPNIGRQLITKHNVAEAIRKGQEKRSNKLGLSAEWVLQRLKDISDRCIQAQQVTDKEGNPIGDYKFDAAGANKATELIGKHLGMFTEKVEHTGKDGGPIDFRNLSPDQIKRMAREVLDDEPPGLR